MCKIYGIVFKDNNKKYYFKSEEEYSLEDLVIVLTERGEQLVKIVQILDKENDDEYNNIIRKATEEDNNNYINNLKEADKAYKKCNELVKEFDLEMSVVNAQYNLDKSQLLFNFTADNRVDFREKAKKLAGLYHTRIELRQIGARDKAKEVGGIGVCGGELCCIRFLKSMNTITMHMAKDQNLALNPSKINGACGRLLCCLEYEDENYLEALKGLPSVGDSIKTEYGEGQVVGIDVLNRTLKLLVNGEKIDYDFDKKSKK